MTKLEKLNMYCGDRECEDCPVYHDEESWAICHNKMFVAMTEEEQDILIRCFEGKNVDPVEHPAHYETGKFECIEVMEEALGADVVKGFCLGNAFKYLYRCKHKEKELEDIQKAIWYLKHFEKLSEVNNE